MNFHDNQINVGLYPREGRVPTGVTTRADAHVTNGAGYAQENISFLNNRVILGAGLRFDEFRYNVVDKVTPQRAGSECRQMAGQRKHRVHALSRHSADPVRELRTRHQQHRRAWSRADAHSAAPRDH